MKKKYGLFIFIIVAFFLCCENIDKLNSTEYLLSSSAKINQKAKTILFYYPTCISISETETNYNPFGKKQFVHYEISGDTLYLSEPMNQTYTGNDSIFGRWFRVNNSCTKYKICEFLDISTNEVKFSADFSDACAIEFLAEQELFTVDENSAFKFEDKTDCKNGIISFMDTLRLEMSVQKLEISGYEFSISLGDKSCVYTLKRQALKESLCTIENLNEDKIDSDGVVFDYNEEEFQKCMEEKFSIDGILNERFSKTLKLFQDFYN